jgi:ubiquinone/menaquinone biosynthesis C-methylase UbiE
LTPYLQPIDHQRAGFGTFYDELPLWSAPFGLLLLENVPLRRGITILDIGAGTGFLSVELAQRCGRDATVIAVDPWAAGMERLRAKCEFLGLANVRLVEIDAALLDLPAASVDLVVSNLGLNNFDDPGAVAGACFRLARPGATIALTTNVVGHMEELYDVFDDVLAELRLEASRQALARHVEHRGTVTTVESLLRRAGFAITRAVTDAFTMRFADGSSLLRHHFIRLGFLPGWKDLIPEERAPETFRMLEQRLDQVARTRGSLDLTIPMAYVEGRKP